MPGRGLECWAGSAKAVGKFLAVLSDPPEVSPFWFCSSAAKLLDSGKRPDLAECVEPMSSQGSSPSCQTSTRRPIRPGYSHASFMPASWPLGGRFFLCCGANHDGAAGSNRTSVAETLVFWGCPWSSHHSPVRFGLPMSPALPPQSGTDFWVGLVFPLLRGACSGLPWAGLGEPSVSLSLSLSLSLCALCACV